MNKYHGVSTKIKDHQLIAASQFPRVFGDEMLSLALGLKSKCRLDRWGSYCLVKYGAQVLLDGPLAPRPGLRDAQRKRAKLDTGCFALAEDALNDLITSRWFDVSACNTH